jgi:CheY-like chemotaxis protein
MESPARSPITQEKQRGSMFWFTVTFQQMEASPEVPEERVSALTGVRMLVVDDSEANRFLVRTLLHNWGCRAGEAINGEHALEVLEEAVNAGDPYRFAFMDLMMPGIDGAELGRRVKRSPILKDTHLILMTSLGEQGDRERIMGIGFAGYFTKPFRQKQLRDAVEAILAGRHASTEPTIANRDHDIAVTASNARILVAEDNPINQLVALKILAKLGYKADTVANGAEAVEAVESSAYDIILMDCQMPEMDGFEATRALRGRNRTIPIIAMTANAMKGDRELCIESGMNDYLSKPVKSSELAAMLERWLPPTRP